MDTDRSLTWAPSDTIPDGALSTVRICPTCGSAYDSSAAYCHRDGTKLGSGGGAAVAVAPVLVVRARPNAPPPAVQESTTLRDAPSPFERDVDALPQLTLAGLPRGAIVHVIGIALVVVAIALWAIVR